MAGHLMPSSAIFAPRGRFAGYFNLHKTSRRPAAVGPARPVASRALATFLTTPMPLLVAASRSRSAQRWAGRGKPGARS